MNYISMYPSSAFIYIFIGTLCLFFSCMAVTKKNINRKNNAWVYLIIILLSVFAGLRGKTVGIDVFHYIIRHIEPIREGLFFEVNQPIGFKLIVWLVYLFTDKTYVVFLIFAFITNGLIIRRFWDFRNKVCFPLVLFLYYCFYYLITFNVFRQFMSIAIIFYCTRFLENKKYIKYAIGVTLAMSIHNTAILGIVLLPLDILLSNSTQKQRKYKKLFLIASPFLLLISTILMRVFFDYQHYLDLLTIYSDGGIGFVTLFKIAISFIIYLIIKRDANIKNEIIMKKNDLKKVYSAYLLGLIISLLVIFSNFADRFAWYFLIWEPIFLSLKIKNRDAMFIIRFVYILLALYTLYVSLNNSGQGIMPYVPFWFNY